MHLGPSRLLFVLIRHDHCRFPRRRARLGATCQYRSQLLRTRLRRQRQPGRLVGWDRHDHTPEVRRIVDSPCDASGAHRYLRRQRLRIVETPSGNHRPLQLGPQSRRCERLPGGAGAPYGGDDLYRNIRRDLRQMLTLLHAPGRCELLGRKLRRPAGRRSDQPYDASAKAHCIHDAGICRLLARRRPRR